MRWFRAFCFVIVAGWRTGLHHLPGTCVDPVRARRDGRSERERLRRGSGCSANDGSGRRLRIVGASTMPPFAAISLPAVLERFR